MKIKGRRVATVMLALAVSAPLFAEITVETDGGPFPVAADPVAELRTGDDAFALLIECFRQLQTSLIEADYDHRLAAAARLTDPVQQQAVRELSAQERELRLEKLDTQLGHMLTAYTHSRRLTEREANVTVPQNVDTVAAARKLEDFVAIIPVVKPQEEIVVTRIVPAHLVLRPKRAAEVSQVAAP